MDLYLPALPQLAVELGADDASAQLTLGACMVGLALGQLVAGPLSDRYGRKRPLIAGVIAFVVLSIACAIAPTIEVLIVARVLQGVAGATGIVISMAVARDLTSGQGTARLLSLLVGISSIAPVIAPLLGGALMLFTDWRGLFVALALIGLALVVASVVFVPETLPRRRRTTAGARAQLVDIGGLLGDARFMAIAVSMGATSLVLFGYIQMSPLLFQGVYGLDAQQYAVLFAVNSTGILLGTQLNRLLLRRFGAANIAAVAVTVAAVGSAVVLALALASAPLWAILAVLFVVIGAMGCIMPNIAATALAAHEGATGTAAAVVGVMQYLVGAVVPPIVAALAGVSTTVMAITMLAGAVVGLALLIAARPARRRRAS